MFISQVFGPFLMMLAVLIVLFVACREVVCWYLKINKILPLLEKIEENTRKATTEHDRAVKTINDNFKI